MICGYISIKLQKNIYFVCEENKIKQIAIDKCHT